MSRKNDSFILYYHSSTALYFLEPSFLFYLCHTSVIRQKASEGMWRRCTGDCCAFARIVKDSRHSSLIYSNTAYFNFNWAQIIGWYFFLCWNCSAASLWRVIGCFISITVHESSPFLVIGLIALAFPLSQLQWLCFVFLFVLVTD